MIFIDVGYAVIQFLSRSKTLGTLLDLLIKVLKEISYLKSYQDPVEILRAEIEAMKAVLCSPMIKLFTYKIRSIYPKNISLKSQKPRSKIHIIKIGFPTFESQLKESTANSLMENREIGCFIDAILFFWI